MFELCRELGMEVYPHHDEGDVLLRIDGVNHRYRGLIPRINPAALVSIGVAFKRLQRMAKRLPIDAPWEARGAKRLDRQTLGEWLSSPRNIPSPTARRLIDQTMTVLFCADPAEVSLLGSMVLARGGGGFEYYADSSGTETHLIDGGAPELARRAGEALDDALCLSSPVRRISQSDDGVEVAADGLDVRARRVIVATPPVLAGRIDYEPRLPATYGHLLNRLLPGSVIRGIAIYEEPFWRRDGLSGETVDPSSLIPVSIDQVPRSGTPGVLSSYAFGPGALEIARLEPDERRRVWLSALAERFGPRALTPVAFQETDWSAERWSLGGMIGFFPPGVLTTSGTALRAPAGRIHWAGTERATAMHGLMEGAVRSGERAADEVLAAESP
jgi:monoamine oxidase